MNSGSSPGRNEVNRLRGGDRDGRKPRRVGGMRFDSNYVLT